MQADVTPHGRIGGGQTGEIAETRGGVFDHFRFGDCLQVIGRANDIVGDDVRQVGDDRQHLVVMLRIHLVDLRAERFPEAAKPRERSRVGFGKWRENAPASLEQTRETGVWSRLLRPGKRMAGDEVNMGRHMWCHLRDHGGLGGADIRNDRTGLQMRRDLLCHGFRGTDRHRDDYEIRILNGLFDRQFVSGAERKLLGALKRLSAAGRDCHVLRKAEQFDVACDGRADQSDPDEGNLVEHRIRHCVRPMNSPSASITPRLASSVPTVMRSALAKP